MKTTKWQTILTALNKEFTDQEVADRVGTGRTTITRLRIGYTAKCDWELGENIIALHKEVYPVKRLANA